MNVMSEMNLLSTLSEYKYGDIVHVEVSSGKMDDFSDKTYGIVIGTDILEVNTGDIEDGVLKFDKIVQYKLLVKAVNEDFWYKSSWYFQKDIPLVIDDNEAGEALKSGTWKIND